jgi:hypothetical protein
MTVATFARPALIAALAAISGTTACTASTGDPAVGTTTSAIQAGNAISRGMEWVDAELQYCESAYDRPDGDPACSSICRRQENPAWDAYRSDCSGFITWSWGLPPVGDGGYVTGDFAPYSTSFSHVISAATLAPGDAANRNSGGHIVLFKQWVTVGATAVFMEEPGCSSPTPYAHEFTSSVSVSGSNLYIDYEGDTFTAIRFDGITSGGSTPPPPSYYYRGMAGDGTAAGYWIVGSDGGIFSYGNASFEGSMGGKALNAPVVGMAAMPSGKGYWLAGSDGGIFTFGEAGFHGSMGGTALAAPVVGIAATPSGDGYWLTGSDGGVFSFGDAGFFGSMGGHALNAPVVGMAATPSGGGYWLVASDGGIFSFGDAPFYGSMGGKALNAPVVGMAATPSGGYWLVAADGGIFSFGDAAFFGSMGGKALNAPIVGMAATPKGDGYWLVAGDGGVFTFGGALFAGSRG